MSDTDANTPEGSEDPREATFPTVLSSETAETNWAEASRPSL